MADSQQPRSYSVGEDIKIGFELADERGIGAVRAQFFNEDAGASISLKGNGAGARSDTVQVSARVVEDMESGNYELLALDVTNMAGKDSHLHPNPSPRFYIEPHAGEDKGADFGGWRFID